MESTDPRAILFAFLEVFTDQAMDTNRLATIAAERTGYTVEEIKANAADVIDLMLKVGLPRLNTLDDVALLVVGMACGAVFVEHGGSLEQMRNLQTGMKVSRGRPKGAKPNPEAEAAKREIQQIRDAGRWTGNPSADAVAQRHGYSSRQAMYRAISRLSDCGSRDS